MTKTGYTNAYQMLMPDDVAVIDLDYSGIAERIRISTGKSPQINGSPQSIAVCSDVEHLVNGSRRVRFETRMELSGSVYVDPKEGVPRQKANEMLSDFIRQNPDVGIRIYNTRGGRKYIITHRPVPWDSPDFEGYQNAIGSDKKYAGLVRNQKCYAARISPKFNRIDNLGELEYCRTGAWIPFHLYPCTPMAFDVERAAVSAGCEWFLDGPYQAWKTLMEWAASIDAVTSKFVGQIGPVCEEVQKFVDYHDHCCNSLGNGPIL